MSNRLVASSLVTSSVHEGGIVFFHSESGQLFSSNRTGAAIWNGITERLSVDVIAAQISNDSGVEYETAHDDVDRFIAELVGRGLIVGE